TAVVLDAGLPIRAGADPSQGIRIAVLIQDTAVADGDHADVPYVPGRPANHDGPVGQRATGSQLRDLRGSRGETDGCDTVAGSVDAEDLERVGAGRLPGQTAQLPAVIGPHDGLVEGDNRADGIR